MRQILAAKTLGQGAARNALAAAVGMSPYSRTTVATRAAMSHAALARRSIACSSDPGASNRRGSTAT